MITAVVVDNEDRPEGCECRPVQVEIGRPVQVEIDCKCGASTTLFVHFGACTLGRQS